MAKSSFQFSCKLQRSPTLLHLMSKHNNTKHTGKKYMNFTMLPVLRVTPNSGRNKSAVEFNMHTCIISPISMVMISFSIMCSINSFKTSSLASITRFFFRASWWYRCMPHAPSILAKEWGPKPNSVTRADLNRPSFLQGGGKGGGEKSTPDNRRKRPSTVDSQDRTGHGSRPPAPTWHQALRSPSTPAERNAATLPLTSRTVFPAALRLPPLCACSMWDSRTDRRAGRHGSPPFPASVWRRGKRAVRPLEVEGGFFRFTRGSLTEAGKL